MSVLSIQKSDFAFTHSLRVRWAECDAQGIVFNVNYFLYVDVGITEYFRELGFVGDDMLEFYTAHAEIDYRSPAKFDEIIDVAMRVAHIGRSSVTMETAIFRGDQLLTQGKMIYVHADKGTFDTSPVPATFIQRVSAFEKTPPERG